MPFLRSLLLDVGPLRLDHDFRLMWTGQAVSNIGRQVTVVALPYQLFVLTGSPLSIGALALVQLGPLLAFSLYGGAIADVHDRRRLLVVTQSGLAATSLALAFLATLGSGAPIWAIYLIAFVAASISAVDQPARSSAMPRLVPPERLAPAIAVNQVGFQTAGVLGPAVGGLLIAAVGLPGAYLVDAASFGASLGALFLIAPIPPSGVARRAGIAAVAEGLRFARSRPVILSTFVADLDAMIFGMPAALFPVLALTTFHAGPAGVGLLASAPAFGALVGAVLTGWVSRVRFQGRAVLVAIAVWGVAITGFGLATFSFPIALAFLALAGGADVLSAVFRSTIIQLRTPDDLRGRVSALHLMVVTGGPRIGDMEASAVAAATTAQLSVVSGGVLCLLGLAWIAWRFPQLAAYDAQLPGDRPPVVPAIESDVTPA